MIRRRVLLAAAGVVLAALVSGAVAKAGYNQWAKEKIRYAHQRVVSDPYNAEKRVVLANAYFEDGNAFAAARELEKAIELAPDYPEAHCNLGIVRHAQRQVVAAEAHYREALRQDSTLIDAMAGLGTLLCTHGRRGEGIDLLEATLQREPGRDDARYNLGVAYHKVGDFRRAVMHLDTLYTRSPGHPGARWGLAQACFARGLTLLQAKLPAAALELFGRSIVLHEGKADVHYAAGLAHLALADLDAAETEFRAAVSLEADHVPALHNLGHVLEKTGHEPEARECFARVARLTPHLDSIDAARNATYDEAVLFQ